MPDANGSAPTLSEPGTSSAATAAANAAAVGLSIRE
jgi:hypothetical protein